MFSFCATPNSKCDPMAKLVGGGLGMAIGESKYDFIDNTSD